MKKPPFQSPAFQSNGPAYAAYQDETQNIEDVALGARFLAPMFKDKFDYSDEKNYDALAEMAFKQAQAIIRKRDKMLAESTESYNKAKAREDEVKAKAEAAAVAAEEAARLNALPKVEVPHA